MIRIGLKLCPRVLCLLLALAATARGGLTTWDGKHAIDRIEVTVVYFVPRDRTPLADWRERVDYFRRRIERFHQREFDGQSRLTTKLHPQPFVSSRGSDQLRAGDGDFIFFQTLREVDGQLHVDGRSSAGGEPRDGGQREAYPILLVLSDLNWRPLDDFYRLRRNGERLEFDGQLIHGGHFPGSPSGGARATYLADRGVGWGLVSADGWRVPYRGSDCVVYHEGVGHAVGLPHPEPGNGSVMSLGQYKGWLSESWLDEPQKSRLGWKRPEPPFDRAADAFSAFRALPRPAVPKPGDEVSLMLDWPAAARVRSCRVRIQTDLAGPWREIAQLKTEAAPETLALGKFDRPTPVSYRVDVELIDGEALELWGYLQVRAQPDEPPLPAVLSADLAPASGPKADKEQARAEGSRLPRAAPEEAGMNAARLEQIDDVVEQALAAGKMPGCVTLIARHGKIVFLKAYGRRSVEPTETPMTVNTVFDLASLTKPVATATSVMLLAESGKLSLDDPLAKHLPEFAQQGKEAITIRQLLTHQGGLIADNAIADYADGREKAIERTLATTPRAKPGESFIYSDVGFITLGELVRRVSGQDLDRFAAERIFEPLGLTETSYLPGEELRRRAAPTEKRGEHWMQGEVHDPRAYALGGVAGHAGLFSTAEDLAVYAQMLIGQGERQSVRILRAETVAEMTRAHAVKGGLRALGWDMRTGYSSNRGQGFSERAFGHGGFTGTALWIDPELDLIVIFLSNRVHPNGKGAVNPLAGRIGTIAAEAIEP